MPPSIRKGEFSFFLTMDFDVKEDAFALFFHQSRVLSILKFVREIIQTCQRILIKKFVD